MNADPTRRLCAYLDVALEEAYEGLAEGGVPIGAALFDAEEDEDAPPQAARVRAITG